MYFIIDSDRRSIVGWWVATDMKTETVLEAIEVARGSRGKDLPELRCHSDADRHFSSIRYGERLDEIDSVPSVRSVGGRFYNSLTETVTFTIRQNS